MTKEEFILKVAAGLRKINIKPDYFIISPELDNYFKWDEDNILGFKVIKTYLNNLTGYNGDTYLILPAYDITTKHSNSSLLDDIYWFQRGYTEY